MTTARVYSREERGKEDRADRKTKQKKKKKEERRKKKRSKAKKEWRRNCETGIYYRN